MNICKEDSLQAKVLKAYNWMALNIQSGLIGDPQEYSYEYTIRNRHGVCQGQAELFKAFMDRLNVECILVSSPNTVYPNNLGHAWNMVKMDDGHWYNIDATWNGNYEAYSYNTIECLRNEQGFSDHVKYGARSTRDLDQVPKADGVYYETNIPHYNYDYSGKDIIFDENGIVVKLGDADLVYESGLLTKGGIIDNSLSSGPRIKDGHVDYAYDDKRHMVEKYDYTTEILEQYEYNDFGDVIKTVHTDYKSDSRDRDSWTKTVYYNEENYYKEKITKIYRNGDSEISEYYPSGKEHVNITTFTTGSYRINEYSENRKLIKTEYNDGRADNKNGYVETYEYQDDVMIVTNRINSDGTFVIYYYYSNGNVFAKKYNNAADVETGAYYIEEYSEDYITIKQEYHDGTEANSNGYVRNYYYYDDGSKEIIKTYTNGEIYIIVYSSDGCIKIEKTLYTNGKTIIKEYASTVQLNNIIRVEYNDGTSDNKDGYVETYEYYDDWTGYTMTTTYSNGNVDTKVVIY